MALLNIDTVTSVYFQFTSTSLNCNCLSSVRQQTHRRTCIAQIVLPNRQTACTGSGSKVTAKTPASSSQRGLLKLESKL